MKSRFVSAIMLALLTMPTVRAQDRSWIITIATGDTLAQCSLLSLDGDTIHVTWSGFPLGLPVESLLKLQHHRPSEFWRGAFYGSAVGAVAGTAVSTSSDLFTKPTTGILGMLVGSVIGGLTADYLSRDIRYDMAGATLPEKKFILKSLLERLSTPIRLSE
jgi:hypothetical protein